MSRIADPVLLGRVRVRMRRRRTIEIDPVLRGRFIHFCVCVGACCATFSRVTCVYVRVMSTSPLIISPCVYVMGELFTFCYSSEVRSVRICVYVGVRLYS